MGFVGVEHPFTVPAQGEILAGDREPEIVQLNEGAGLCHCVLSIFLHNPV